VGASESRLASALEGWVGIEQTNNDHDDVEKNSNWVALIDRFEARFGRRADDTMIALLYDQGRAAVEAIVNGPSTDGPGLALGLGAILAIVFRSPVVAVVVGVVYALPLESAIGAIGGSVSRWLPGRLLAALAAGGNSTASLTAASWTIAVYAMVAIGLAVILFTRRDVPA
jgi:hypothetical protein